MDKINLNDILDGKRTLLPFELNSAEAYDFVITLSDALAARQTEFHHEEVDYEAWDAITDNYLSFLLNEGNKFTIEALVAAFIRAVRIHHVTFNADTDTFSKFFQKVGPWIVPGQPKFPEKNQ